MRDWRTASGLLELIQSYTSIVLNLDDSVVDCLRT